MRHLSRRKDRIAGLQAHLLLPNFNEHLATLYQIKPLLLLEVQMARWAAPCHVGVLQKEEPAVRVLGCDLEIEMTLGPRPLVMLAKPVRARRHKMSIVRRRN